MALASILVLWCVTLTTVCIATDRMASGSTAGALTNFVRDRQGTLIAMRTGSTRAYYLTDALGSVVGLVNSGGTKVNSYSYDPYGVDRGKTEQVANPFKYTGGYLDDVTGLYNKLGIRYYDPTLGRFTQPDPTGQDPHYTYALNNPCNFTDPSGAAVECEDVALVGGTLGGAAIGAAFSVATFGVGTVAFAAGSSFLSSVGGGTLLSGIGIAACGG